MPRNICLFTGEALAAYHFGQSHPFGPLRHAAFYRECVTRGLEKRVCLCVPEAADAGRIALFHTPDYIARVKRQSMAGTGFLDDGDTPAIQGIYEAAACVVGTTLAALDRIITGECRRAFVPIAGLHHAQRDRAAGFCVFNDCGVAIEYLRRHHGLQRIAYVDIDAHHGDGVFYSYEDDADVIFADVHEDGDYLYPGTGRADETGRGRARGSKLNIPLPPGADDSAFHAVWQRVEDHVRQARPEFILLQCGADSLAGDPITHLRFSSAVHAHAARRLCAIADECCGGHLLAMGGGGYALANLADAWCAVLQTLVDCTSHPA